MTIAAGADVSEPERNPATLELYGVIGEIEPRRTVLQEPVSKRLLTAARAEIVRLRAQSPSAANVCRLQPACEREVLIRRPLRIGYPTRMPFGNLTLHVQRSRRRRGRRREAARREYLDRRAADRGPHAIGHEVQHDLVLAAREPEPTRAVCHRRRRALEERAHVERADHERNAPFGRLDRASQRERDGRVAGDEPIGREARAGGDRIGRRRRRSALRKRRQWGDGPRDCPRLPQPIRETYAYRSHESGRGSANDRSTRSHRSRGPVRSTTTVYPAAAHATGREPVAPGGVPTPGISVGPQLSAPGFATYLAKSFSRQLVTTQATTSRRHRRTFVAGSNNVSKSGGQCTPRDPVALSVCDAPWAGPCPDKTPGPLEPSAPSETLIATAIE